MNNSYDFHSWSKDYCDERLATGVPTSPDAASRTLRCLELGSQAAQRSAARKVYYVIEAVAAHQAEQP